MSTSTNVRKLRGYGLLMNSALYTARKALRGLNRLSYVGRSLVTSNYVTFPGRTVTRWIKGSNRVAADMLCELVFHLMIPLSNRDRCPVWGYVARLCHKLAHVSREDLVRRMVFGAWDTNLAGGLEHPRARRLEGMARNPFVYDRDPSHDEDSEFGFGRGQHPDPNIDYSDGGTKSGIPIADPDQNDQLLTLRQIRRMDINDPNDQPSPYVEGNTDRYGAQPPLVRERKRPRYTQTRQDPPKRMKRAY